MLQKHAEGVRWDLSDLYRSPEDPRLAQDLKEAKEKAVSFEQKHKPFFDAFRPGGPFPLAGLLQDYKVILTLLTKAGTFAALYFAVRTNDSVAGAFYQRMQETLTDIRSHLIFFPVRWNGLSEETVKELVRDPALAEERHFLEKMRVFRPYTLSEPEEKIMAFKDNTSRQAFVRLFDEIVNKLPFEIELEGKKIRNTEPEVLALLHSKDRQIRQKASESLAQGLENGTHVLVYIYNMILSDYRLMMKIRGYGYPMDPRNLSNETDRETVRNLIQSVQEAYPVAQRYYKLKRELLGLDKLYDYDRYAPLETDQEDIPFERCREIVLQGYEEFSSEAGEIARKFFDGRWIDAEVREGKRAGGFCSAATPDLHPYILVNYTGSLRDVMVLAHELGHGLHQYLAGRRVGILEANAPLTMAETASVFGEMLIFEKLMAGESDALRRLGLVCGKIDDHFATVYRQIVMTDFELMAHETGLAEGELTDGRLSDFWMKANAALYGGSLELTEHYRHGWKYIPHFIHTPFYCYAYAFAQLFVLSLYRKYKENPEAFVPVYLEMLSYGGAKKPENLAAMAGLDLTKKDFWKSGLALLEDLVRQAEELAVASR